MTLTTQSARPARRVLVAFLTLVWLAMPSTLWAMNCTALDINDLPRNCTWLEEHGQCLVEAIDSRDQCLAKADGVFEWYRCHEDAAIDLTVCNLQIPFRVILR